MKIYTGQGAGKKFEEIKKRNLGVCISSTPNILPHKELKKVNCFIDNGAFSCYLKGYPFQEDVFLKTISKAYKLGIKLDFIVCPDLLMRGKDSLQYSMEWSGRRGKLRTSNNLALVVQDGILPGELKKWSLSNFTHIFIGGSVEWKWETAAMWREFATKIGKKLHIGQCGRLNYLKRAYELGADSVDSTSFCRNDSWHIVDEYKQWEEGYMGRII